MTAPPRHAGNGRIQRLAEVTASDSINSCSHSINSFQELLLRVMRGETLHEICDAWAVPHDRVLCWLIDDDRRYALYLRALSESERRAKPSCGAVL